MSTVSETYEVEAVLEDTETDNSTTLHRKVLILSMFILTGPICNQQVVSSNFIVSSSIVRVRSGVTMLH